MAGERERLFLGQLDTLRGFVRLLVRDEDAASELLQEVALVVFEHPNGPCDKASFPLWCRGIARHLTLHRRRAFARLASFVNALEMIESSGPIDGLERSLIARQELVIGFRAIDKASRQLLFEYVIGGASSIELAARWNVSPAAIRMRLARLRSELRSAAAGADKDRKLLSLRFASRGNLVSK